MIKERVYNQLQIEYNKRVLIYDKTDFSRIFDYNAFLSENNFEVFIYDDVEKMRYIYETQIKVKNTSCVFVVLNDIYVPSDIRKSFNEVELSLHTIYPSMDASILKEHIDDIDLIDLSYDNFERNCLKESDTKEYISKVSYSEQNILEYINFEEARIQELIDKGASYREWKEIARINAKLEKYACIQNITRDQSFIDRPFKNFIFDGYQKLYGITSTGAPVILPKVTERIIDGEKTALIVADGMSLFDFEILRMYMKDFNCIIDSSFAMIPTTTSISRQSLLSGKYPQELENPFSLAKEESEFYSMAERNGFTRQQAFFGRGYNVEPNSMVKFAAVIINDIDDMVHGQQQGRLGMYNDDILWAKSGKIQYLIIRLLEKGFKVYLTSDHGNTHCIGKGRINNVGVETETKSKRMVVFKDFAEITDELEERTDLFPGYYQNKKYKYLVSKGRTSFDNINEDVMTHGGISLEEVIVPFVEVRKNG